MPHGVREHTLRKAPSVSQERSAAEVVGMDVRGRERPSSDQAGGLTMATARAGGWRLAAGLKPCFTRFVKQLFERPLIVATCITTCTNTSRTQLGYK